MFFTLLSGLVSTSFAQDRHPTEEAFLSSLSHSDQTPISVRALDSYKRIPVTGEISSISPDKVLSLKGWRGERVNAQVVISSGAEIKDLNVSNSSFLSTDSSIEGKKIEIPIKTFFVKYTQGGGNVIGDIINNSPSEIIQNPAGINRVIWVQIDIPPTTPKGTYSGKVLVKANGETKTVPLKLEVSTSTLPTSDQWKIHLDLWQQPQSVARWHDVTPWSSEHFSLLKPLMQRLAQAGQKVITVSMIDEPWGGQTYDWFPSMIEWKKNTQGELIYDYTHFDQWVSFMMDEIGIKEQISCYTMIPWSMKIRYYDESTNTYKFLKNVPGSPEFEHIWADFLTHFKKHLQKKNWLNKTCIAIDERPDAMAKAAKSVIDKYAPEFRLVSAVDHPTQASDIVYDLSPKLTAADSIDSLLLKTRQKNGQKTTFYVCCDPPAPNTFTASPIAEAQWLGLFAATHHLDGFLRWAYNSWNRNPFESTKFGNWKDGDCFLVYPNNRTSLRFEKLRDGFEDYEKIQILRKRAQKDLAFAKKFHLFEQWLKDTFNTKRSASCDHADDVKKAEEKLFELSQKSK